MPGALLQMVLLGNKLCRTIRHVNVIHRQFKLNFKKAIKESINSGQFLVLSLSHSTALSQQGFHIVRVMSIVHQYDFLVEFQ